VNFTFLVLDGIYGRRVCREKICIVEMVHSLIYNSDIVVLLEVLEPYEVVLRSGQGCAPGSEQ
jgi:hypothetical protein